MIKQVLSLGNKSRNNIIREIGIKRRGSEKTVVLLTILVILNIILVCDCKLELNNHILVRLQLCLDILKLDVNANL